jgi:DNA-binding NarL/FixJ family response regulator
MRASRVIYVENDPALRGIMTSMLNSSPHLEVILSTESPTKALQFAPLMPVDVAFIDLALGVDQMTGIDLGIALRRKNPTIGIVLHSQYPLEATLERVPDEERIGWSTLQKSGQMELDEVVAILRSTAMGFSHRDHSSAETADTDPSPALKPLNELSERQHSIMGLTAAGFSPQQVAQQLEIKYDLVRQDLVRAYKILVPEDSAGEDRRTQAVLAYVRLTRDETWETP